MQPWNSHVRLCTQLLRRHMPRVTVLIPSYMPEPDYVLACLAGLEAQTYRDFEVLIIDESKPEVRAFLSSCKTSFPLRIMNPQARLGLAKSLNYGIANCLSELIARHDIDDICEPERLEKQVTYLDAHKEVSAVGSATIKIGADGENLGVRHFPLTPPEIKRYSGMRNPFCHSAITLRRSFFEHYGLYSEDMEAEDYELWLRALKLGAKMINLPEALVQYRIETHNGKPRPRYWRETFSLRARYLSWDNLLIRLTGLLLTGIAAITPPKLFDYVYWIFNRLR